MLFCSDFFSTIEQNVQLNDRDLMKSNIPPEIDVKTKMNVFAYLRVSTLKQAEYGTIENQMMILEEYCKFHPELNIVQIFKEDGISAFKERPLYNEMMKRLDEVDGIISVKLSRIGRSAKELLQFADILIEKQKHLIFIKDSIDTSTPQGKLFFTLMSAFNEYEAALIHERLAEGHVRARAKGTKYGRKSIEMDQKLLNRIKKDYECGIGCDSLAKIYKCSKGTIRNRLKAMGVVIRKPRGSNT